MQEKKIDCRTLLSMLMPTYRKNKETGAKEKFPPVLKSDELTSDQRKAIIIYLCNLGRYHGFEIAEIVGSDPSYISRIKKQFENGHMVLVDELEVKKIAGKHIKMAERAYIELNKKGKWKDGFEVMRGLIEDLQSLGYLHREPETLNIDYGIIVKRWEELFGVKLDYVDQDIARQLQSANNNN